jgi:hypothetical protein
VAGIGFYRFDGPEFEARLWKVVFSPPQPFRQTLGLTQPPVKWYRGSFRGLNYGFDNPRPCSTEVKNRWSYSSTLPVCLHGKLPGHLATMKINLLEKMCVCVCLCVCVC